MNVFSDWLSGLVTIDRTLSMRVARVLLAPWRHRRGVAAARYALKSRTPASRLHEA